MEADKILQRAFADLKREAPGRKIATRRPSTGTRRGVWLAAAATALTAAASAQNIDKLAEKYTGRDGVTVIKMDGDMVRVLDGKDGVKINGVDVSKEFKGVKTVTMIVNENGDAELARELRLIVDGKEYTPLMDVDSSGDRVRIAKKDGEVVISVDEGEGTKNLFIRVEGDPK